MFKIQKLALLTLLSSLSLTAYADNAKGTYVVAPACLLKNMSLSYETISQATSLSFIKTNKEGIAQLVNAKNRQKQPCGGFFNVTDAWHTYAKTSMTRSHNANTFLQNYLTKQSRTKDTYSIQHEKETNELIATLNPNEMWSFLSSLTSFQDRYGNSDNGVKAAYWFKDNIEKLAKQYGRNDVSVELISTGSSYKQPSVVVKVGNSTEPAVVIGGHMDTLASFFDNKPGAGDDGSGSVTVLEVAKTLLASNMQFKRPIYFMWYSAGEEGLIGSQHVVAEFKKRNIPVAQVLHMDMTGYANQNDPTLWLIKDHTNPDLTSYLETLINTYVKKPVKYTACGYACSDHATWTQNGYKSAIAFGAEFGKDDPYIHTQQDTMDALSLTHMTDYAKLATAFMVELAEPVA